MDAIVAPPTLAHIAFVAITFTWDGTEESARSLTEAFREHGHQIGVQPVSMRYRRGTREPKSFTVVLERVVDGEEFQARLREGETLALWLRGGDTLVEMNACPPAGARRVFEAAPTLTILEATD